LTPNNYPTPTGSFKFAVNTNAVDPNLKFDVSTLGLSIDVVNGVTQRLFKLYYVGYFDDPYTIPSGQNYQKNWCLPYYENNEDNILLQVDQVVSPNPPGANYKRSVIYSFEYFLTNICVVTQLDFPVPIES
jgi:hypothetical protein